MRPLLIGIRLFLLAVVFSSPRPVSGQSAPLYSVLIEGGTVIDGTGRPGYTADVGILDDRIADIGDLSAAKASIRIEAQGLVVAPGFIDIHTHADGSRAETSGLALRPLAENYLRQGVTTVFGGQDGGSPLDLAAYLAYFDAVPSALNIGMFVGHGSIRAHIVGEDNRPATPAEIEAMKERVTGAMRDGAFGVSSGLEYTPGGFAPTHELVELAAASAPYGGVYISHVRDEGGGLLDSVTELIRIAEEGGVAAQLTHHKIIGKGRWGGTAASLAQVDEARSRGVDVTLDVYPYTASSTGMTILFPSWAQDGGFDALLTRLGDPAMRERIRSEVIAHIEVERGSDPATIVAASCRWDPSLNGLSLADMAAAGGLEPTVPNAADIAIRLVENGSCQGVFHSMSEDDVQRVMSHPAAMVASDGGVPEFGSGSPHPRSYGSFARLLARYVRELETLSLETAVHKITGAPASRLRLASRGVLRPGAIADVTVFDADSIQDHAAFGDPHRYATGVRHVFVGGRWTLQDGEPTGIRAGRSLRRDR